MKRKDKRGFGGFGSYTHSTLCGSYAHSTLWWIIRTGIILAVIFSLTYTIFKLQPKQEICNVGVKENSGDYFPKTRTCAIQDCAFYNDYQEEIGGSSVCLV